MPISAFPDLPPCLSEWLQARGCTVPQAADIAERHNVIQGELFAAGEAAWAVVCSRNFRSELLVFRHDEDRDPLMLIAFDELDCTDATWDCGYSLAIRTADRAQILYYRHSFNVIDPLPPIDHHGLEVASVEKASVVRYFHDGEWLTLRGAD